MKSTILQSTLREMRALGSDGRSWAVLAVLSLVAGMIGPFGSFEMPILWRLGYWTAVVIGSAAIGSFVATLLEQLIGTGLPPLPRALVAGALAGLPIVAMVMLLNLMVFGLRFQPVDLANLTLYCMAISAAVTMLGTVLAPAVAPNAAPSHPALLNRLPLHQRGRLLHLAVADHYVEVSTDRGKALLLLRLSDAMRETAPIAGLQVHRSHWVALAAVRKASRQSGKPVLELENGAVVPISRSFMADARAAGLVV